MSLSKQEVEDLALLARLSLSEAEVERMQTDLTSILGHIETLQKAQTDGVEPMTHAVPMELRLREDVVGESFEQDTALADAPDRAADYFQVPHIISSNAS